MNSSLRHLTKLNLCLTEYSAFTYRSVQAATRYAYDLASLLTSVSSLRLESLEVSQPAVTPDLLLLRLFYRDFLQTFPSLKSHDLVWRSVQGKDSGVIEGH